MYSDSQLFVWRAMLDADMNARYWRYMVRRAMFLDNSMKYLIAATTSSTAPGLLFLQAYQPIWNILVVVSALMALALSILDYKTKIERLFFLSEHWARLRHDYEYLWHTMKNYSDPKSLNDTVKKLKDREANLDKKEIGLPIIKRLLNRCFDEVKKARGLDKGEKDDR